MLAVIHDKIWDYKLQDRVWEAFLWFKHSVAEGVFLVEDYDQKILSNPQKHIINKGGSIFFAKKNKKIIGVVALMPTDKFDIFELTKMGVKKSFRNQGVGRLLINKCIEKVKLDKLKKVIIYSNRKLENAIYLYKSFGFTEVELEKKSNYQRADIKLELRLK